MDKPHIGISDDYAVMDCQYGSFYYGYEELANKDTDDEEWCFSVTTKNTKVIIPHSKLGDVDQWEPVECLLAGIGIYLDSIKQDN